MKGFFHPRSVAVIGVSPRRGNLGRNIMGNLDDFGFAGPVYPVSPRGGQFNGRTIYTDVRELPETPELAVVLTPAASAPGILEACGKKGIKRVIIETAGFSELAAEGLQAERSLLATAEKYGMRFVGPNCLGIICTASGLATPFARLGQAAPRGPISIASQSGGVGLTYVQHSLENGLGLANFASVGNKLNVNERDILAYFIEDPHTEIILLHLESIVAGREIFDLIRSTDKPVVVHKSNIGDLSRGIAQSHTAALANDDAVVDAALEQAGAVRARSITDCQEILKGLSLPRAKGGRIAVISRSGGHAVVAADAAFTFGMELPPFPDSYLKGIQDQTRASVIKLQNPLDLGDLFDFGVYVGILQGALELEDIDGVLFVHVYGGVEVKASREFAVKAGKLSRRYDKPVAMVLINGGEERRLAARIAGMPTFRAPHEAMLALSAAIPAKKARPGGRLACADPLDQERAERILLAAREDGVLELPEALHLIAAAGIPVAPFAVAGDPDDAVMLARSLGYPAVLKAVGGDISHKTERGGVALGLEGDDQVRRAAEEMIKGLGLTRLLVMRQIKGGTEIIVGGKQDHAFGPLVLLGLGGVTAEALRDVSLKLAPVEDWEAGRMLDGLRGAALLKGFRGAPPANRAAILQVVMQASILISRLPQIKELDINPLLAGPNGIAAVDARVRVGRADRAGPAPRPDKGEQKT